MTLHTHDLHKIKQHDVMPVQPLIRPLSNACFHVATDLISHHKPDKQPYKATYVCALQAHELHELRDFTEVERLTLLEREGLLAGELQQERQRRQEQCEALDAALGDVAALDLQLGQCKGEVSGELSLACVMGVEGEVVGGGRSSARRWTCRWGTWRRWTCSWGSARARCVASGQSFYV